MATLIPVRRQLVEGTLATSSSTVVSNTVNGVVDQLYIAYIVTGKASSTPAVSSIAGMGLTWTLINAQCGANDTLRIEAWYAIGNAATGAVTATLAASADEAMIHVIAYDNAMVRTPIGASADYNTNGAAGSCGGGTDNNDATGSITTTATGSVVVNGVVFGVDWFYSLTSGWEWVEPYNVGDTTIGTSIEQKHISAAAGAVTVGAANSLDGATDWALVAVEILGAPAPLDDQALSLWLYDAAGTLREPIHATDATLEGTRFQSGAGSITIPTSSPLVDLFMGATVGQEFSECSVRAFYRDNAAPLWSGPMTGATMKSKGDTGTVEITFEQFFGHFNRRRIISESAMGSVGYATAFKGADNIALNMMEKQIGSTVTTPATYPLGVSRTDHGSFSPEVAAEHGPALSSSQPAMEEQSGVNLRDFIEDLCEQEDLAPVCTDNLDQTFGLDIDYPFEDADLSATVIFGQWYGNLLEFEASNDIGSLANVWSVEGATAATHTYTSDAASITVWGVLEGRAPKPQDTANAPDVATYAAYLKDRYAGGTITYRAKIAEVPGCLFNQDWGHRDRVTFDDAVHGYQFEQVCKEWRLRMTDGGPPELEIVFGDPPLHSARMMADYVGTRGPRMGGGRGRSKRGI